MEFWEEILAFTSYGDVECGISSLSGFRSAAGILSSTGGGVSELLTGLIK